MKVIGIDPSLANTCVVVGELSDKGFSPSSYTLLQTKKSTLKQVRASSDLITRCRVLVDGVKRVIAEERPLLIFVETPSGSQSADGMKNYGISCCLIATLSPHPIEVTPHEVKMASVGNKSASKREMIDWASTNYPELRWEMHNGKIQNKMEHLADALAVVQAGVKTANYTQLSSLMAGNMGTL